MYYPDCSLRPDVDSKERDTLAGRFLQSLMVGWLEDGYGFETGEVSSSLVDKMILHASYKVNRTRGFYLCPFWVTLLPTVKFYRDGEYGEVILGSAEIFVQGADGRSYFAPDLIIHYVTEHFYRPPEEFLEALETSSPIKGWEVEQECILNNFRMLHQPESTHPI